MKYKIDTTTWKRREHYEFFNGMYGPGIQMYKRV